MRPSFANVASQLGVDFTFYNDEVAGRYYLPEVMGGGAAWLDYDLDGRLDLYLVNGAPLEDPRVRSAIQDGEATLGASGRLLIRKSGTEPVIRVMAEGEDQGLIVQVVDGIVETIQEVANPAS